MPLLEFKQPNVATDTAGRWVRLACAAAARPALLGSRAAAKEADIAAPRRVSAPRRRSVRLWCNPEIAVVVRDAREHVSERTTAAG